MVHNQCSCAKCQRRNRNEKLVLSDIGLIDPRFGPVSVGSIVSKNIAGAIVPGFALDVPLPAPVVIQDFTGYQFYRWFGRDGATELYFQFAFSTQTLPGNAVGTLIRVDPATEQTTSGPTTSFTPPVVQNFVQNQGDVTWVGDTIGVLTYWNNPPGSLFAVPFFINRQSLTFTVGAAVAFAAGGTVAMVRLAPLGDNRRFCVVYSRLNGNTVVAIAGTVVGGVVTMGIPVAVGSVPFPGNILALTNLIVNRASSISTQEATLSIGYMSTADFAGYVSSFIVQNLTIIPSGALIFSDFQLNTQDQYAIVGVDPTVFLVAGTGSNQGGGLVMLAIALDASSVPTAVGSLVPIDIPQGGKIGITGVAGALNQPYLKQGNQAGFAVVRKFGFLNDAIVVLSTVNVTRHSVNNVQLQTGQFMPMFLALGVETAVAWFDSYPLADAAAHLALRVGVEDFQFASRLKGNAILGVVTAVTNSRSLSFPPRQIATVTVLGTVFFPFITLLPGHAYYATTNGELRLNPGLNISLAQDPQTLPLGIALNAHTLLLRL